MSLGPNIASVKKKIMLMLSRRRFLKNVLLISGGTALAQFVAVLSSPILSRLYTPADFGVVAVFSSILGLVSVVATFSY